MNIFGNFWFWVLAILPGLSKSLRDDAMDRVTGFSVIFDKLGYFLKDVLFDKIFPYANNPVILNKDLQSEFTKVFNHINNWFNITRQSLQNHATTIAKHLEPEVEFRSWRIFGYLFQLCLLLLFIYADAIQLLNNLVPLFDVDPSSIPSWLTNLTLSLIMSSVGIAITAGFIFADFSGITHFGKWNNLKGWYRYFILFSTILCLVLIILIDTTLALSRIIAFPRIAAMIPPDISMQIMLWAIIASSLVIIPMLITTFILLSGFVGIAVLYICLIWTISLLFELIHMIIIGLISLFTFGLSYIIIFLMRAILYIVTFLLFLLGWFLTGTGFSLKTILAFAHSIINLIYFPFDLLFKWIGSVFVKGT